MSSPGSSVPSTRCSDRTFSTMFCAIRPSPSSYGREESVPRLTNAAGAGRVPGPRRNRPPRSPPPPVRPPRPPPPRGRRGAAKPSPAGLARGAVRDLVGLVRDPPEVLAAPGARPPIPVVNGEVIPQLGGKAAQAAALDLQRFVEHRPNGPEEALPLQTIQRRQRGVRGHPGPVKDVVGIAPADPGHGALVPQDRVDPAGVVGQKD